MLYCSIKTQKTPYIKPLFSGAKVLLFTRWVVTYRMETMSVESTPQARMQLVMLVNMNVPMMAR